MRPQTDKEATGPFSRKKLLTFLEKKAKEEKDWENIQSYVKKESGKFGGMKAKESLYKSPFTFTANK